MSARTMSAPLVAQGEAREQPSAAGRRVRQRRERGVGDDSTGPGPRWSRLGIEIADRHVEELAGPVDDAHTVRIEDGEPEAERTRVGEDGHAVVEQLRGPARPTGSMNECHEPQASPSVTGVDGAGAYRGRAEIPGSGGDQRVRGSEYSRPRPAGSCRSAWRSSGPRGARPARSRSRPRGRRPRARLEIERGPGPGVACVGDGPAAEQQRVVLVPVQEPPVAAATVGVGLAPPERAVHGIHAARNMAGQGEPFLG